jgi:hypothetical protein
MVKQAGSNPATPTMSAGTPKDSATGQKAGQTERASKGTHTQDLIALRAYELYEQRDRQEGRALEDWLNAERQVVGVASHS